MGLGDLNTALIVWLPLVLLWIFTLIDLFRNKDITGLAKGLWALLVIWVPVIGALIYWLFRGQSPEERAAAEQYEHYEEQGLRARGEHEYDSPTPPG